jgi:hypothetical protein
VNPPIGSSFIHFALAFPYIKPSLATVFVLEYLAAVELKRKEADRMEVLPWQLSSVESSKGIIGA